MFLNLLRRLRAVGKVNADGMKKSRPRDRAVRAMPAPEANAELQANLDVCLINCLNFHLKFQSIRNHMLPQYCNIRPPNIELTET